MLALVGTVGCNATEPRAIAQAASPLLEIDQTPAAQIRPPDVAVAPPPVPMFTPPQAQTPRRTAHVAGSWTPPVKSRQWMYIVVHHSATPVGNAASFDREHREKGWDELGYHFVVGNGAGSGDGTIEVGPRWSKQKYGAHAKTPDERYNNFGIGVCLVGNFESGRPTAKQVEATAALVAWLMETYDIPPSYVIGHRDTKATACPGKFLNVASIRTRADRMITDAGGIVPHDPVASSGGELLHPR